VRAGAVNVGDFGTSFANQRFACDSGATKPALLLDEAQHIVPSLCGSEEEWAVDGAKGNHDEHQNCEQRSETLGPAGIRSPPGSDPQTEWHAVSFPCRKYVSQWLLPKMLCNTPLTVPVAPGRHYRTGDHGLLDHWLCVCLWPYRWQAPSPSPSNARWRQQLVFRDALRADPGLAQRYAVLKMGLASEHVTDRETYTAGKADFIAAVLGEAGDDALTGTQFP